MATFKWISIFDKEKPKDCEKVLTVHRISSEVEDKVSSNLYILDHFVHSSETVTHWAHFPEPPKEEE